MNLLRCFPVLLLVACGGDDAGPQNTEVTVNSVPAEAAESKTESKTDVVKAPWTVQSGATVNWEGFKPTSSHTGGFNTVTGQAEVEGQTLQSLVIEIDMNSIHSDKEKLTRHLKDADFFDVENHPKARFTLTSVNDPTSISGNLEILGKTQNITAPIALTWGEGTLGLKGSFSIDRTLWGITYKSGTIGTVADKIINDKVDIDVDLSFATP